MIFPTLVYKCPGDHQCQHGTYSYLGVADDAELAAARAQGWFLTLPEAMSGENAEPADDAPPSREELEEKARELGIKFDGRTGDAALLRRIEAELEAQEP